MNNINGKSIDEVILSCDKDGNGIIDYNEFKAAMLMEWAYYSTWISISTQHKMMNVLFINGLT